MHIFNYSESNFDQFSKSIFEIKFSIILNLILVFFFFYFLKFFRKKLINRLNRFFYNFESRWWFLFFVSLIFLNKLGLKFSSDIFKNENVAVELKFQKNSAVIVNPGIRPSSKVDIEKILRHLSQFTHTMLIRITVIYFFGIICFLCYRQNFNLCLVVILIHFFFHSYILFYSLNRYNLFNNKYKVRDWIGPIKL